MPLNVHHIRQQFPNLDLKIHGKQLVYLDNAATTFKPKVVIEAVNQHYQSRVSNVHRGVHFLSEQATGDFEASRQMVAQFIHAKHGHEIIFTKGTTDSINLVAHSFGRAFIKEGDEILISHMEHHSNIVPWQMLAQQNKAVLKVIPINDQGELMMDEFERLLNPKVKIVSIVYVSNSLGTVNPISTIIQKAHALGIPVLIDAAQAVTHKPINVQTLDCDFLVFSGHKIFGPTGVGVLYGKERLLNAMPPYQGGGDMIASVTFEKTTYNVLPYKFEAGTPAIAEVIGLGAAIKFMMSFDFNDIMQYKKQLLDYGTRALSSVAGVRLIGTASAKSSILSFIVDGIHPHDLGTLVDQQGVAIRTGHHCTQPVMDRFKVPATARASLAMYNTTEEIDALVDALMQAKKVFGV